MGLHDGGITAIRISTDGHTADLSESLTWDIELQHVSGLKHETMGKLGIITMTLARFLELLI